MTLEVGNYYRGVFGTSLCWLYLESIGVLADGTWSIAYRVHESKRPIWLRSFGYRVADERPETFVSRLEEAQHNLELENLKRVVRKVQAVEVKYK